MHEHTHTHANAHKTMEVDILLKDIASGVRRYPFRKILSLYPMGSEKLGWSEIAIGWCIIQALL